MFLPLDGQVVDASVIGVPLALLLEVHGLEAEVESGGDAESGEGVEEARKKKTSEGEESWRGREYEGGQPTIGRGGM